MLVNLAIFAAVGLICWLGGWRTLYQYGAGLVLVGVTALALGVYGVSGGLCGRGGFGYQYAALTCGDSAHERANREREEVHSNHVFFGQMCAVGFLPIVAGILIQIVFGSGW